MKTEKVVRAIYNTVGWLKGQYYLSLLEAKRKSGERVDVISTKWFPHKKNKSAIQRALDWLNPGGMVFLEAGTYEIDTAISIPVNNVSLIGAGKASIIDAQTNAISIITVSGALSHILLKDFKVTHDTSGSGKNGVLLGSNQDHWIIDGVFFNENGFGCASCIVTDLILRNCYFYGGVRALTGDVLLRSFILNNTIETMDETALYFMSDCGYNLIAGNIIRTIDENGIYFASNVPYNIVKGNLFIDCSQAMNNGYSDIYIASTYNLILDNIFRATQANKVKYHIREHSAASGPNIIKGNIGTEAVTEDISIQHADTDKSHNIEA